MSQQNAGIIETMLACLCLLSDSLKLISAHDLTRRSGSIPACPLRLGCDSFQTPLRISEEAGASPDLRLIFPTNFEGSTQCRDREDERIESLKIPQLGEIKTYG